jgi:triosephosphate isomerase
MYQCQVDLQVYFGHSEKEGILAHKQRTVILQIPVSLSSSFIIIICFDDRKTWESHDGMSKRNNIKLNMHILM